MTRTRRLLALVVLSLAASAPAHAGTPAAAPAQPAAPLGAADTAAVQPDTEAPFNVLGTESAPVAMVEFSDLQCPYCARYALQTFPLVKRAYIDKGLLHYAAVDFPLPMHPYAIPAAVATRCAGEQGKFWQYRESVFADQSQLASDPFDALASKLGLDVAKFKTCRRDLRQDAVVRDNLQMAMRDGIASTPTFMIGRVVDGEFQGETVTGARSFDEISKRIDAYLPAGR
jgi:protein-disulfide isomerase